MADEWVTLHQAEATNQIMAAGASEFFFSNENNRSQMLKFGQSFNALEIINDGDEVLDLDLDAQGSDVASKRRRIFARGAGTIKPEEGTFFSVVKLTNRHATDSNSAGEVKLVASIKKRAS